MPLRPWSLIVIAASLTGCALRGPPVATSPGPPQAPAPEAPAGTAQPAPAIPAPPPGAPEHPPAGAPRQFHLSAATAALVTQAHAQSTAGDFTQAAATLERALRIEPANPLLWIELGRVRLEESNAPQAEAMARKALALAAGDGAAQSAAWHLIGDSLRARGRNGEAAEADARAAGATPH